MLSSYFKLAIKVLGRHRFFTFISLFGISFTLMILMVTTSFLETELGSHPPLTEKDRMVLLPRLIMKQMVTDTTWSVDTTMLDGQPAYDSTFTVGKKRQNSYSSSSLSYSFLDRYMRDIPGAEAHSFFCADTQFDIFINGKKLNFKALYSDATYWEIFDFNFLAGRSFQPSEVERQVQVAVLSRKAAVDYFGTTEQVVGRSIEMDGKQLEVIGIVEQPSNSKDYVTSEVYLPLTLMSGSALTETGFHGPFTAVFLAGSPEARSTIVEAIRQKADRIPLPNPEDYNKLELMPATVIGLYAYYMMPVQDDPEGALQMFTLVAVGLMLLFILLPTLNLINLNISRAMERSAEIGVRKAFGAHSGSILAQLVFENVVLTFLGGILGWLFALALIYLVNDSQVLGDTQLQFNTAVFLYSLLICLVFGILSGLLPAYRMSKLHIVNAIKFNNL
ncbi:MAG: ABC transporter permease [Phaeodactylibacter xiamenensis]|uniref:ABC transporter permease n=1 Tax=Phaeodactylibacter xiamenensis TaxID=1524460 RepID=A0A098SAV3_9BACT|nr:FtsX-like permease family protein [Phaeodactylibacter xiamenensis]KGE88763.1 hypothetical protein IX84_06360 [Phaeodactylibacter xiamenensis]MCR9051550.1 ABC transporter permease [bacterium]